MRDVLIDFGPFKEFRIITVVVLRILVFQLFVNRNDVIRILVSLSDKLSDEVCLFQYRSAD